MTMKKQLSFALLTLGLISFNILPAQAQTYSAAQFCFWFPHLGEICYDL
jgi:hypothetical protein